MPAPPPTRGWTPDTDQYDWDGTGSPAHAGMDPSAARPAPHRRRLPRPRGDGPDLADLRAATSGAPPPTRGWTFHGAAARLLHDGSPAHAGMDRARRSRRPRPIRLPRPRGDGPSAGSPRSPIARAPPPTRGWTPVGHPGHEAGLGSPAHAGMDPRQMVGLTHYQRLPRPRGDGPFVARALGCCTTAPPPTRGWTRLRDRQGGAQEGSPAHAGMDRIARSTSRRCSRLPRPRGDGPL